MTPATRQRELRVFYRDYAEDVVVPSTQPHWLPVERLAPLADRLLGAADNFIGVIDRNDVILQCYAADTPGDLVLELLYPEATGCLRLTLPRAEALARLDGLPALFDESLLSGAQYID